MTEPQSTNGHAPSGPSIVIGAPAPPAVVRRTTWWQKIIAVLTIGYGVAIACLCAWMYWQGDNEWLATLILFGPRWVCATPLPFLVLAAAIWYRRMLWVAAVTGLVILFPFLGFKAHIPAPLETPIGFRVMTCNLAKRSTVIPALAKMVIEREPDIVALQEIDDPPRRYIWPERWHVAIYNELALVSRWPISEIDRFFHPFAPLEIAGVHFLVAMPDRKVHVFNLHLRSPRKGFEAVLDRRTKVGAAELDAILEVLRDRVGGGGRVDRPL